MVSEVVCRIHLLARLTRPKGQKRRATIGCLVHNMSGSSQCHLQVILGSKIYIKS